MMLNELSPYWSRSLYFSADRRMRQPASQPYLRACGAPSLERQQQGLREAGRIGYIGNEGPALGTSLP
jgi:hypothetical protein